jgi:branched-chain amino acid transport system permease protein
LDVEPASGEQRVAVARRALHIGRPTAVRASVAAGFIAIVLFVLPWSFGADWITTFTSVAIYSVVALGLGILYGRVGMISLGQIALLGIGTWTATRLDYATGMPFPLLLLVTGAITCVVGVLIGLPALRLSGLYLALVTLMAAGAVTVVLTTLDFPNGGSGFTGHTTLVDLSGLQPVHRPSMAVGDTAYFRYVVVISVLMFLLGLVHVASKPGRAWAAIRESEPAALAAGVNITRYKMWAFALASFMTGVAGCLLAAQSGAPKAYNFPTQDSITLFATALIGGVFSLWGAVVAGVFFQLVPSLVHDHWGLDVNFLYILFGVGILQVLLTAPGGIVQQFPKDMANLGRLVARGARALTGGRRQSP